MKIPVTNTQGEFMGPLLRRLVADGVKVNVTALMTVAQVEAVMECLAGGPAAYVSVFAGRIADTGRDPIPIMTESLAVMAAHPNVELIWASPRDPQHRAGRRDRLRHHHGDARLVEEARETFGKDLDQFSLETVQMFHRDATASGYQL